MARTKGSGWGAGTILYQECPNCKKKKAMFKTNTIDTRSFKCTSCKIWFSSDKLLRIKYVSQLKDTAL